MKKISEKNILVLTRKYRKYWNSGDTDYLDSITKTCYDLERESDIMWNIFHDLFGSFTRLELSDEKIIELMELMGFKVVK